MIIESPAFRHGGSIPPLYTCDGKDINPPLRFGDVPKQAQSLVLIVHDPDVPRAIRSDGIWNHWLVWNIPPNVTSFPAKEQEMQIVEGKNTSGSIGYEGPCPPDREHRYYFTLTALDIQLAVDQAATKKQLLKAMEGHMLATAQLIGRYKRK